MVRKIVGRLPEIVVIFLCTVILSVGISQKEGFHLDEVLSYEFSNAEYNPWVVSTQPEGRLAKFIHNEIEGEKFADSVRNLVDTIVDVLQNRRSSKLLSYQADIYEEPVWISSEQFRDYITVDGTDDFNYFSVYFNSRNDVHPPFFHMLLHTMSSLFKGLAEPFVGCLVNIIALVISMVLLMKTGRMLAEMLGIEKRGRFLGIFAALLYGSSTGALASVLLVRMYCVVSCLCLASFYVHLRKWREGTFKCKNAMLIAVTVLGFLTQYFFLFYCILLAAVTAVFLLCSKRTKELLIYIRSMIIAAGIGVICFPFAISHVLTSDRGVEAFGNLASGFAGYGEKMSSFLSILSQRTFGGWLLIVLAVLLACFMVIYGKEEKVAGINTAFVQILCLLLIPVVGYFLLAVRMSPYLVDRYIMPVFPFVMLIGAVILVWLACFVERRSGEGKVLYIVCGVLLALQLVRILQYDGDYLYKGYEEQRQVSELYAEYPCICVYNGVGYYENLLEFVNYERTLLLSEGEFVGRMDVETISGLDKVVVLVKDNVEWQRVSEVLSEKYGLVFVEELYSNGVYGDMLLLFGQE